MFSKKFATLDDDLYGGTHCTAQTVVGSMQRKVYSIIDPQHKAPMVSALFAKKDCLFFMSLKKSNFTRIGFFFLRYFFVEGAFQI